ncbi:inositol monophosphatase [Litorivicinus sp.]|nr:inositol monophosphatase [Litorivicinus sp.]
MMDISSRLEFAKKIVRNSSAEAVKAFSNWKDLTITAKGAQDFVSEVDKSTELYLRARIQEAYPDDGIVGEEFGRTNESANLQWVLDPIDGTANYISGVPAWCIVIAIVEHQQILAGVIYDPNCDELFSAQLNEGAFLNDRKLSPKKEFTIAASTLSLGYSGRTTTKPVVAVINEIFKLGGVFSRNGSGALSLAHVADQRYSGYIEHHMNAWDCLAGQLIVKEAGGLIEDQNAREMIALGGRVIVGWPGVFEQLLKMANDHFGEDDLVRSALGKSPHP